MGEGSKCPECANGVMKYKVVGCSCHIAPPCSACVDAPLECDNCGNIHEFEREPMPPVDYSYMPYGNKVREVDLGNGKKLIDYDYDSRSGSTMVWKGRFTGDVTAKDILDYFGTGTFGHRGPSIFGNSFTFTQITD
jgi:hypothetical protein